MFKLLILRVILLVSVVLLAGCGLADLREDTLLDEATRIEQDSEQKGRRVLATMFEAHGGATFDRLETVCAEIEDTWPSWMMRAFVVPWEKDPQTFRLCMQPGKDNSQLTFLDGPRQGEVWGIQNWATYTLDEASQKPHFEANEDIWFWLPTVQYFTEAAFRLHEAQYVGYAGERTYEGRLYDGVFLTWESVVPSKRMDQYVAWVERETGRLGLLEYTVRDMFRFVTGTAVYTDYASYGLAGGEGVLMYPGLVTIHSGDVEDGDILHVMRIASIALDAIDEAMLLPEPTRRANKSSKGE